MGPANDLYSFSPATVSWTALAPSGVAPLARSAMGFAATPDGLIYLWGGYNFETGAVMEQRGGKSGREERKQDIILPCLTSKHPRPHYSCCLAVLLSMCL